MEILSLSQRLNSFGVVPFFAVVLIFNATIFARWTGQASHVSTVEINNISADMIQHDDVGFACNPILAGTTYTEDFDTLANTGTSTLIPQGWLFSEALVNMNATYTASVGSSTTGDTYSFGPSANSDRAFGGLQSGSLLPTVGACFVNNTGATVSVLNIGYDGEQWRLSTTGRNDRLDFEYSIDATSLTTGTWTPVDALDFIAPLSTGTVGAVDGNVNKVTVSSGISGLSLVSGATVYIRYIDLNAAGADDGLGVDNFNLSALPPTTAPVSLSGRVIDSSSRGIRNAVMLLEGGGLPEPRYAATGSLGYYSFDGLATGSYVLTVNTKRYTFATPSQTFTLTDNVTDADFVAEPQE
jgi:hypothetical protein